MENDLSKEDYAQRVAELMAEVESLKNPPKEEEETPPFLIPSLPDARDVTFWKRNSELRDIYERLLEALNGMTKFQVDYLEWEATAPIAVKDWNLSMGNIRDVLQMILAAEKSGLGLAVFEKAAALTVDLENPLLKKSFLLGKKEMLKKPAAKASGGGKWPKSGGNQRFQQGGVRHPPPYNGPSSSAPKAHHQRGPRSQNGLDKNQCSKCHDHGHWAHQCTNVSD